MSIWWLAGRRADMGDIAGALDAWRVQQGRQLCGTDAAVASPLSVLGRVWPLLVIASCALEWTRLYRFENLLPGLPVACLVL